VAGADLDNVGPQFEGSSMRRSLSHAGCCPAHDPCPRHLAPDLAAAGADRARQVDGVEQDELDGILDSRGVSRRNLMRLSALLGAGTGAAFVAAAASPVAAAPGANAGSPVFDPRRVGKVHVLPSTAATVRVGAMDPTAPNAVEIESGDVVHYPDTWVNWANEAKDGMSFAEREPIRKRYPQGPYSLVGPVAIKGAEPGDVIECRMLKLETIDWGWNSTPKGVGALPTDFDEPYLHYLKLDNATKTAAFAPGVTIPLAPIQGVLAAQPAGDKPVSGILSGPYGGNIVLRELVEGTSLFLPVQVAGGRIWTGDSHAAQGDGVVDQTAIETAMKDLRIQYVLHKRVSIQGPIAETPTHWIVLGFGPSLEDALTASLRETIAWLSAATGLSKLDIYALASVAGSFRVTQYAHQLNTVYANVPPKAVHGMIPKAIFAPDRLAEISRSVRSQG
jgi:acetamidase/formamidase